MSEPHGHHHDHDRDHAEQVVPSDLADPTQMHARKEAWAAAYRATPHGAPVTLDL